jgi:hypothetical protein
MDLMTAGLPSEFLWWVAAGVSGGVILAIGGMMLRRRGRGSQEPNSPGASIQWTEPVFLFMVGGWVTLILSLIAITWLSIVEKEIPGTFTLLIPMLLVFLMGAMTVRRK